MSEQGEVRRLTKSRSDRMIDGVCGGVGEYFGLDSTLVRIAWVLLTLFGGVGIVLYILAMIIMPKNPNAEAAAASPKVEREANSKFWGILLIAVGGIWFLGNMGVPIWHHWWWMAWDFVLPIVLILAGVAFMHGGRNSLTTPAAATGAPPPGPQEAPHAAVRPNRLYKSRREKKIAGVCGGLAEYFSMDPTIIRLLFIIALFASFGFVLLFYLIMVIVVPKEPLPATV
ncbi:MAG TPA: PspC domain-containing protein [Bacteroidota bacterium]|nr:PspC domain-containing protein [Bacteroidota bacterium]